MDLSSQDTLDEEFKRRVDNLTTFSVSQIDDEKVREAKYHELENFNVSN